MNYNRKKFSVALGAAKITQDNWERTFGKKEPSAPVEFAATREEVGITGVWVRTQDSWRVPVPGDGPKYKVTEVQVLVGLPGIGFRLIQQHVIPHIEQTISEHTSAYGITKAPEDVL